MALMEMVISLVVAKKTINLMKEITGMKTIYIAGPMTGLDNFNYPEFNRVAKILRDKGFTVENPAENKEPECKSWVGYMRLAIAKLIKCDAVFLLENWEQSKGAIIEHKLACDLGMKTLFSEEDLVLNKQKKRNSTQQLCDHDWEDMGTFKQCTYVECQKSEEK